jgi:hypothetical protein
MYLTEPEYTSTIAEKTENVDNFKNVKFAKMPRFFINILENPKIDYHARKVLALVLPYFDKNWESPYTDIPADKILDKLDKYNKRGKFLDFANSLEAEIGLTFEPITEKDDKRRRVKGREHCKFFRVRFIPEVKEGLKNDKTGYTYLRRDYFEWFQLILKKYKFKNAVTINSFFCLTIKASTWDIPLNIGVKRLTEEIGLKDKIKYSRDGKIKTDIPKYLGYLEQEGLIKIVPSLNDSQVVFTPTNYNSDRKEKKRQQKEEKLKAEAEANAAKEAEAKANEAEKPKTKKIITLVPKNSKPSSSVSTPTTATVSKKSKPRGFKPK